MTTALCHICRYLEFIQPELSRLSLTGEVPVYGYAAQPGQGLLSSLY